VPLDYPRDEPSSRVRGLRLQASGDEEQVFDVLKDKLSERQAGASTNTAKPVPIQLIYRVLNLL